MNELKDKDEQYSVFLNYKDSDNNKNKNAGRVLLILTTVSVFLCVIVFAYIIFTMKNVPEGIENQSFLSKIFSPSKVKRNFAVPFFNKKQNILILGIDSNGSDTDPFVGTRTDTIILINIDPADKTINAISVPRDSKVYLPDEFGVQKINSAHALGGVELTKKTIEETLGLKIDKYVLVNNDAIKKMVDALGGVPIYVEKNMFYNDYSANLHINLTKGLHVLNGEQAEGYLRYRKDGLGDIGRTSRQQWFLKALLEKLQSTGTISKIPEVLKIAFNSTKTDMSLYEMSQFAALVRSFNGENVEIATLPGAPSKKGYISYWILDPEKTQEVVNRLIYRQKTSIGDKKLIAGIMYAYEKEDEAMKIKARLEEFGYEVNCVGRAQLPHSQFIGHNSAVSSEFVSWLKKKVPEIRQTQFVYDPIRMYCVKSDFTIIIAQ